MLALIQKYLLEAGFNESLSQYVAAWGALLLIILVAWISLKIFGLITENVIHRLIRASATDWDDKLTEKGFFRFVGHLIPVIFLSIVIPEIYRGMDRWIYPLEKAINLYLIIVFMLVLVALIRAASSIYSAQEVSKRVPLVSVFQIAKLIIIIVSVLLAVATVLDKSPAVLLSGIGALTAVLILVFKDTILGFVAGIQIAANKMLAHGDWLEMPSQGVDGNVLEVGLNTIKVRNWDNTISFLPTYTLISQPYKNWRGMEESGGRRFKRRIVIDPDSVQAIENGDFKTNLGQFRHQVSEYLDQHEQINQQLTKLVRIVNPDQYGVHLEIYFFILDKRWVYFEGIAAGIYEDLLVMMKQHGLKICTIKSVHQ